MDPSKPIEDTGFLKQLKQHEGLRLKMYKCSAGFNTIGYGFNLDENDIPLQVAEILLDHHITQMLDELDDHKDLMAIVGELSPPRQAVILNMLYNLGLSRLRGFKRMWAALGAGDYDKAATEMLDSKWSEQVGRRAEELSHQMRSGDWVRV